MKYLFKTVETNHYGTASFEVFEKDVNDNNVVNINENVYLFMPVNYKGYGANPPKLEIKINNGRYIAIPSNHPFESNLVETLRLYLK